MKNINLNIYQILAFIILVVGLFFSYLVAELDDAPGFIIIGSAVVLGGTSILFGVGEIIKYLKVNNQILTDINSKLNNK